MNIRLQTSGLSSPNCTACLNSFHVCTASNSIGIKCLWPFVWHSSSTVFPVCLSLMSTSRGYFDSFFNTMVAFWPLSNNYYKDHNLGGLLHMSNLWKMCLHAGVCAFVYLHILCICMISTYIKVCVIHHWHDCRSDSITLCHLQTKTLRNNDELNIHAFSCTDTHTRARVHTCILTHTHTHECTCTNLHTPARMHAHTQTYTCMHINMDACICTHTVYTTYHYSPVQAYQWCKYDRTMIYPKHLQCLYVPIIQNICTLFSCVTFQHVCTYTYNDNIKSCINSLSEGLWITYDTDMDHMSTQHHCTLHTQYSESL